MKRIPNRYTEEQRAAIEADHPWITLRASAGSGKTSVLTARYLRLVLTDGILPERILCLTFTKAAAAEMKARIIAALMEHGRPDLAQSAETCPIQTIDSLCDRLLRENCTAAPVDPGYSPIQDHRPVVLIQAAIREAVADLAGDEESLAGRMIFHYAEHSPPNPAAAKDRLVEDVEKLLNRLRAVGVSQARLDELCRPEDLAAGWLRLMVPDLDLP
ncbi:MAG: UvrD-helicase domain-containing protein, partial [Fimbriimonadaceae bacterium]|nr:UvrD-helicase domain-containing protein [Fimbriimonadaceae bacterium]